MGRRRRRGPETPEEWVDAILTDGRVVWFPIKHYSPVCAWQLRETIRQLSPVGVLVEGPDDATPLIPHIIDTASRPPLTLLSTYVDKKNSFGLNGVLSPSEEVPARYRSWWPFVEYAPEYQALVAGNEVGAELAFIDTPLPANIPHHHVPNRASAQAVSDGNLSTNAYFAALARRERRRSFEDFWQAHFEIDGWRLDPIAFMRRVLLFAWCARNVGGAGSEGLEADGTLLREAHMRWHVDQFCKKHPAGRVVVVTGAFHAVALPFTKRKRARQKADRYTETVLTSHSYRALSRLYSMNRMPRHGALVWEQLEAGSPAPFDAAAMQLLIEVQRTGRDAGSVVSTADTVGAYGVAQNLGVLRGNREVTLCDLRDAAEMAYVKGDARIGGPAIAAAMETVLVGTALGQVTPAAGQAPVMRDFYDRCRAYRLDVTGTHKTVRCDVHKQEKHRHKSAFLHRCDLLEIPMFARIASRGRQWNQQDAYYKGPDLVSGDNLHLITETWGILWTEEVDARLIDLSDRGASIAQAASTELVAQLHAARGDAAATTKLLLRCAQMRLIDLFEEVLAEVESAIAADSRFENLVDALTDFVVLHSYRDALATQGHARLLQGIVALFKKACLLLPTLANLPAEENAPTLDRLQALVRICLTFDAAALDRTLMIEKLRELVADPDGNAAVRGAGFGILYSMAATREKVVARELESYLLGTTQHALQAGAFLDGLFSTSKSIFMGSPRLLRAINRVLAALDWHTFKRILPDLRRAFTQFIPAELDGIADRVCEEIGLAQRPDPDQPIPAAVVRLGNRSERRVNAVLADWMAS